jgi:PAS domain S-box-containing protein
MAIPPRSERAETLRVSVERLRHLAAVQELGEIPAARLELERALEDLTNVVETFQAERDDARAEAMRAGLDLSAARQILDDGPDGYIVTDSAGLIREANRSAAQLLGVSARFLAGKPLSLFIDEADLRIFRWRVNNVHTRQPGEWAMRIRPRAALPFTAGLTSAPFKMGDPRSDIRWFLRDVTARQRAEELAAAQEFTTQMLASEQTARAAAESARLRLEFQSEVSRVLAESLDYTVALARVAGLVVPAAADVFLVDLLVDDALGQSTMACADPRGAERLRTRRSPDPAGDHPIARVIRTGEALLVTEVSPSWLDDWAGSRESQDVWQEIGLTSIVVVPIRSHRRTHGALTFAFGPSRRRHRPDDLRGLKDIGLRTALALDTIQLFRALEAEQHHRDEFLAMLAHELRNPLGAVTSGLDALERADPSARARILQILSRQSKHLARLLNDLLDVSGARFGRVMLERRHLDLRELARHSLEELQTRGKTPGPTIALRIDPGPVPVVGDADRLQQVIVNLLDNAVKYTPSPGAVELSVDTEGDDAVIRVRDSGVGIAPEFLPRIFEVFARGGTHRDPSSPGLGLGLSVVRELVAKHGGSVVASSPGVGRGSEFVIRLPLDRVVEAPAVEPAPPKAVEKSVLIVEDNADASEVLRIMLELAGHRVRTANSGKEAIEDTRAYVPDVALVDIGLPDIDGCEVGRTVRAQPRGAEVYLVALTGHDAAADHERVRQAGFDFYLVKPVDPTKLLDVIAQGHR